MRMTGFSGFFKTYVVMAALARTSFVDHVGLPEVHLPPPPKCWN